MDNVKRFTPPETNCVSFNYILKMNEEFDNYLSDYILDNKLYKETTVEQIKEITKINKEPFFICFNVSNQLKINQELFDLKIYKITKIYCVSLDEKKAQMRGIDTDSILLVNKEKVGEYIEKYFNSFESR